MTADQTEKPILLTVAEVAFLLNTSSDSVRRLVNSEQLPHLRINRSIRIRRTDLDEFIANGGTK